MGARPALTGPLSLIYVTEPSVEVAKKLKSLRLCEYCLWSDLVYEWEREMNEDSEVLMMIKTRTSCISELTTYIRDNHHIQGL